MLAYTDYTEGVSHYYGYDEAGNIDAYDTYDLTGENAFDSDEYEYTDGKLTSFNGQTISYDSSGRTVNYRGKAITYFDEDANAIKSIGNAVFTYNADGLRRSKTVNGVTHYYYYDGINLVKEEWGDNILVFFYDANGSPVGMQYRNSTYASGTWDTYLYKKNLQGDVIAVYNTSGTKLVSYSYDAWGRILSTTYHNSGANTTATHNPMRYRGYYYDDDLDLYYLATRYYDPEVRRFVTADKILSNADGDLHGYNLYVYCFNNPLAYTDYTGEWPDWLDNIINTWTENSFVYNVLSKNVTADFGVGIGMGGEVKLGNLKAGAISRMDILGIEFSGYDINFGHFGRSALYLGYGDVFLGMESKTFESFDGTVRDTYETLPENSWGLGFDVGFVVSAHVNVSISFTGIYNSFIDYGRKWEWWD